MQAPRNTNKSVSDFTLIIMIKKIYPGIDNESKRAADRSQLEGTRISWWHSDLYNYVDAINI